MEFRVKIPGLGVSKFGVQGLVFRVQRPRSRVWTLPVFQISDHGEGYLGGAQRLWLRTE